MLPPCSARAADEAPVIHRLNLDSQGAAWPASSLFPCRWPQTQTAPGVPRAGSADRALSGQELTPERIGLSQEAQGGNRVSTA